MHFFKQTRTLRLGILGLGGRGIGQMRCLLDMPDVSIAAVYDPLPERVAEALAAVAEQGQACLGCADEAQLLAQSLDAVMVFSSWTTHSRLAVLAMEAGFDVGLEVGGAASIDECWQLVRTAQRTGKQCMMLENCCYGRNEMQVLRMVREGLFGELVHCAGGYQHDLRDEIGRGDITHHYRQANFFARNGELYPTHELGPIAKMLDINRGNRMTHLVSMASQGAGLQVWLRENRPEMGEVRVNQGDIVTTLIKCANGQTITLVHDCTLPRPYSRGGRVQGTKGLWMEDNASVYLEGLTPKDDGHWDHGRWESLENHRAAYDHPLWKQYEDFGNRGGHDGIDYLTLRGFVQAIGEGLPCAIDVYDAAAWMAVTALSEQSVAMGSMPVAVPDFTDGEWIHPAPKGLKTAFDVDGYNFDLFAEA